MQRDGIRASCFAPSRCFVGLGRGRVGIIAPSKTATMSRAALPFVEPSARYNPMKPPPDLSLPHVVVIGAGFAGLRFVQNFPENLARITLIDRQNHHHFQPLLYQVATAGLSAVDIAQPVRAMFGDRSNFAVVMGDVEEIDLGGKRVRHSRGEVTYDYLVL